MVSYRNPSNELTAAGGEWLAVGVDPCGRSAAGCPFELAERTASTFEG